MKRFALALCLLTLPLSTAQAMTWEYFESIRGSDDADLYLLGVGEGIGWANTRLEQQEQPILFCQPRDLAIEADMYDAMLGAAVDLDPTLKEYPIELILMNALQETYPCKKK